MLKDIANITNIDKLLTTHIARPIFAHMALTRLNLYGDHGILGRAV